MLARITKLEEDIKNKNFLEVNKEEKPVNNVETVQVQTPLQQKSSISSFSDSDVKGKLLINLRKIGSEMLWNLIQGVNVGVKGNILNITAFNDGDYELLDRTTTKETIEQALKEFAAFEIQVVLDEKEKTLDEVDEEAKRLKDIFGEDIVIIK